MVIKKWQSVSLAEGQCAVPHSGKKKFSPNVLLLERHLEECLNFAQEMAFGSGYHQAASFAGKGNLRPPRQIFRDTLQGKLAEIAIHTYLYRNQIATDQYPDFSIWGKGIWEDSDFTLQNGRFRVSVKSTKHFGNLLMLESNRYNQKGFYLESVDCQLPIQHDFIFLVRVKGIDHQIKQVYQLSEIACQVTGFLTHADFQHIIAQNHSLPKGTEIGKAQLLVDNYYACVADLRKPESLSDFFSA